SVPYLNDHRIHGAAVFPAAAYIEMALAAAAETFGEHCSLGDVSIEEPLVVPDDGERTVQFVLSAPANGIASFRIFSRAAKSREETGWKRHVNGLIHVADAPAAPESFTPDSVKGRCDRESLGVDFYESASSRGIQFGPSL